MKTIAFTFALTLAAYVAHADNLACWDKFSARGSRPFLTAKIVSNDKLAEVKIIADEDTLTQEQLRAEQGTLAGTKITSHHSPYSDFQGFDNNQYDLEKYATLILPSDLSEAALKNALEKGIGKGMDKDENGVIIGTAKESDGGSHYSVRLRCKRSK